MQVRTKSFCYDNTAFELASKLCRYGLPALVVKLSFEVVYGGHFLICLVVFYFLCCGVTHFYPLTQVYYPPLPTASTFSYFVTKVLIVIHSYVKKWITTLPVACASYNKTLLIVFGASSNVVIPTTVSDIFVGFVYVLAFLSIYTSTQPEGRFWSGLSSNKIPTLSL